MTERSHRIIRGIAAVLVYGTYRTVELRRPEADLSDRPVIIVANHFAGFADPVLMMYGLQRRPRFLAKATLWSNPVVGKLLDLLGVLPISRAVDGATESNVDTFAACHEALRNREVIALFPEGTTHDQASIVDIRTGTARIALGARASGAEGIVIVPVGIHYEDKAGWRSRIYAQVGDPIDLDADLALYVEAGTAEDDSNREAVKRLTTEIEVRLRSVSPDYSTEAEWDALGAAAEVALRAELYDPSTPVSFGDREELADRLRSAPPKARDAVQDAVADYRVALNHHRVRDTSVAAYSRVGGALPDYTARSLLGALALAPTAIAGLAANAIPIAIMTAIRKNLNVEPVTMATVRSLAAPVLYGGTWTAWASILRRRNVRYGRTIAWLSGIVGGWALVLAFERMTIVRDGLRGWYRMGELGPNDEVTSARRTLLDTVDAAIAEEASG
jgi:1-acyl-sn-glycerol-3-phosphate acyltransferase